MQQPGEQFVSPLERARGNLDVTRGTHGTSTPDGSAPSEILPAATHGGFQSYPGLSDSRRAYYTAPRKDGDGQDPSDEGWRWAQSSVGNRLGGGVRARPIVTHVAPIDEADVDLDMNINRGGYSQQMTASKLTVTDTEWIPPINEWARGPSEGVQGTLPNENWNKYPSTSEPRDEQNFKELQRVSPYSPKSGFNAPRVNEAQFSRVKEVPGQMTMLDRPGSWDKPPRKADI